jgi:hypothetical protein
MGHRQMHHIFSLFPFSSMPFNNLQFRLQNRQHICFEGNLIMLCKASCLVPYNESIFLDNIFRHAKEGIILSWTVPGQDGLAHINNKTLRYDFRKILENNFLVDMTSSNYLQDNCGFQHLKKNVYAYTKILDNLK